ncbi:ester cyclase [Aureibaculum marinum]|nr:ester cyclase [Aureibaculum marinum]
MKTKNFLFVFAILTISISYGQKHSTESNIKMYEHIWDKILNQGQIDLINDIYFDTDIILVSNTENIIGVNDFKGYYQNFLIGFSDIEFSIIDIFGQGEKMVKHWNFKGKHTGDFFGIPATGKLVNIDGVTLIKMKNGKIAKEQDFMDNAIFIEQLGLVSNPNNITIIDALYNAFSTGDMSSVLGTMDAAIVWNEAEGNSYADGNPYIGPDAILNGVFARLVANHEYFKLSDIELHEMSNNKVLATLRYDAKNKKTGKYYNAQVAHLWSLKDNKIVKFQQYADTKKLTDAEKI